MAEVYEHPIHITQATGGSWLAASVSTPWFCLEAESEEAVKAKAQRAVSFWLQNRKATVAAPIEHTIRSFVPQKVERVAVAACA